MNRLEAAQSALESSGVLTRLAAYSPTVVSTIWVGLDVPGSDIDVICCYRNQNEFVESATDALGVLPEFSLQRQHDYAVARCRSGDFVLEVFASATPVAAQPAWRHFEVMQRLVRLSAPSFCEAIRKLKLAGLKTEPAIAATLDLKGESFAAVMALQSRSDADLTQLLAKAGHLPAD